MSNLLLTLLIILCNFMFLINFYCYLKLFTFKITFSINVTLHCNKFAQTKLKGTALNAKITLACESMSPGHGIFGKFPCPEDTGFLGKFPCPEDMGFLGHFHVLRTWDF